jgi:hypothetical protein
MSLEIVIEWKVIILNVVKCKNSSILLRKEFGMLYIVVVILVILNIKLQQVIVCVMNGIKKDTEEV